MTELEVSGLFSDMLRVEPVGVCLSGAFGIGKSRFLGPLARSVVEMLIPDEDLEHYRENTGAYIYNRTFEQKYWDGYTG